MRNLRLLALVAPVFFLPLACEDSSGSSSGATFNPEAGGFEAGPSPEAGVPETGVDSSPPAPLGVTVTVTDDALPKSNVRVILQDAAGLVIGEKATDATGKVTLPTAPGMVTVLVSHGSGPGSSVSPVSFVGVADGDKLVVAAVADVAVEPAIAGQFSVAFSKTGVAANADGVNVDVGGCTAGVNIPDPTFVAGVYASCLGSKNALLGEATNIGGLLGFGFAKDLARPAAGPPVGTVDAGTLTFTAPGTTTLNATNVPATNTSVTPYLYAVANSAAFQMSHWSGTAEGGGRIFQTPTGFAEAYQSVLSFEEFNPNSTSTRSFIRREPVPASNVLTNVDYAAALPRITDAVLTKPTAARPEVALTSAAPLTGADGGIATLRWSNAQVNGSWTIVFPPGTTTIKVPALPADATAFVPAAGVLVDELTFIEATQLPSYAELKLLPVQPGFGVALLTPTRPLPLAGTVRVSSWIPGVP
jgi:hypothetical protein